MMSAHTLGGLTSRERMESRPKGGNDGFGPDGLTGPALDNPMTLAGASGQVNGIRLLPATGDGPIEPPSAIGAHDGSLRYRITATRVTTGRSSPTRTR
jgi:hypothetical protein